MQIEDPLPAKDTWWDSITAALSLVMARIAACLTTAFAAYGAAVMPFWSDAQHRFSLVRVVGHYGDGLARNAPQ
jgi:hypothetical protein